MANNPVAGGTAIIGTSTASPSIVLRMLGGFGFEDLVVVVVIDERVDVEVLDFCGDSTGA